MRRADCMKANCMTCVRLSAGLRHGLCVHPCECVCLLSGTNTACSLSEFIKRCTEEQLRNDLFLLLSVSNDVWIRNNPGTSYRRPSSAGWECTPGLNTVPQTAGVPSPFSSLKLRWQLCRALDSSER